MIGTSTTESRGHVPSGSSSPSSESGALRTQPKAPALDSGSGWLSVGTRRTIVIAWALFAGLAVFWDFSWCFVSSALRRPDLGGWWRIWTVYGQIDHRYLQGDPWLLSLEIMTGLFCPALNFYFVHQLLHRHEQKARVALLVVSVMEVYGTVMYFGSELSSGLAHVDTSRVSAMIVFFGLSSLWLVFPCACIYLLVRDYGATELGARRVSPRRRESKPHAVRFRAARKQRALAACAAYGMKRQSRTITMASARPAKRRASS